MRCLGVLGLLCLLALPAQAATPARRFVVFFQDWSAAIDPSARAVIARAAAWAKAHPHERVSVTGAADRVGGNRANRLLSELRAQVVTDRLTTDGVAERRVRQNALGAVGYEKKSQMSRRAIISVGAP
ncbi:MAG: OmpA family protein [Rhodospirillales bacterium]|jgi:outer membrane protein OmpA-like peptidoglycan-associated protein|nr:OmpA family protein [Rhodospirillales bacterium]